jgi:hypothetical protein
MAGSSFQVNVPSGFSNEDVQNLSATEKSMAQVMGLSEDEFRRRKFEYVIGEQRRRDRGRELGELVEKVLSELGRQYQLESVTWNPDTRTWRFGIRSSEGTENVIVQADIADQVIDFRTQSEFQRLRNMVLFGLGRTDLIFKE